MPAKQVPRGRKRVLPLIAFPAGSGGMPAADLVEGRFRMPADEYRGIGEVKRRAKTAGLSAKKSHVLRAGLRLLRRLDDDDLLAALAAVVRADRGE